jgi:hypothetical protein
MAKKLTAFLGQYTETQPNLNAADDDQYDFFFKARANAGLNGLYNAAVRTDSLCPEVFFRYKWTVPSGISTATFHLWGGGGSGAPSYQCQQGVGGGSAAYAYKSVSVTPGDVYTLCLDGAERHCCTRFFCSDGTTVLTDQGDQSITHGERGMKAYVLGTGLDNFCAEGGNPGIARCCGWASSNNGQGYGGEPNFRCITVTHECVAKRSVTDSDNDRYAPAKYYGADGGSWGIYACRQIGCCGATDGMQANRCGDKEFTPYPGGLLKTGMRGHIERPSVNGGLVAVKICNIVGGPHGYHSCYLNTMSGYSQGGGAWPQVTGMGGLTPTTCGGTCCCGTYGGPGMIRISYS